VINLLRIESGQLSQRIYANASVPIPKRPA
jgi:hypothetical protein